MVAGISPLGLGLVALLTGGAILAAWIGVLSRRRVGGPGARQFGVFALLASGWSASVALQYVSPRVDIAYVLYEMSNAFAILTAFSWLLFAVHYSGHGHWLTKRVQAFLWAPPVAYILLLATRNYHALIPPLKTPTTFAGLQVFVPAINWFVALFTVYSTLVGLAGSALIVRFAWRTSGGYRRQALTVVGSGSLVLLTSSVYWGLGLTAQRGLDPTPLSMVGMSAVVAFALFRQDFLSVRQLAPDRLFDELPDPVIVLGDDNQVIEANRAGSGFVSAGAPIAESLPALARALETTDHTVVLDTPLGDQRTYDVTVTQLFDPYDRQQGRVVVLRDITARQRREKELERQNERLDRFASIVSHDLRNPLNVASGHTQLAIDRDSTAQLSAVQDALEDMDSMIEELLTVARTGAGVDPGWVDFGTLVRDAWPFIEAGPTLQIEATGDLQADPDRVPLLLANLYRNARDHGPPDVSVRTGLTDTGFFIADDGPGIPANDRDRVFEEGVSTNEAGTGLGLSIVTTIADAHGWEIVISESEAGGARIDIVGGSTRDVVKRDTVVAVE